MERSVWDGTSAPGHSPTQVALTQETDAEDASTAAHEATTAVAMSSDQQQQQQGSVSRGGSAGATGVARKHSLVGAIESRLQSSGLRRSQTTLATGSGNVAGTSTGVAGASHPSSAGSGTAGVAGGVRSETGSADVLAAAGGSGPGAQSTGADDNVYSMNVADYEMGSAIGYGSSAVVYIAVYKPLGTKVAIKMIDLDMFERNQIDELRREIQIMSLSRHPNLLPVYGSFVHESKLYIVTPFLSAGSCLDIAKTAFPDGFDEVSIAMILKQALEGLVYLHKNGLIHRDVKAGNLLMDENGLVQLADFGVSSSLMETGERKGIRKTFVGTPCWMAPEVMEQSGYDYKADIWSFGITSLELATGHAPFAKFPPLKVLMLTLQNSPPTLDREQTKHKFSKVFKDMIDSCLQKDPTKRPTAEKLLAHPFFKQANKKRQYLVQTVLANLPPVTDRSHIKKRMERPSEHNEQESWDFSSNEETVPAQRGPHAGRGVGFGAITIIGDEDARALEQHRPVPSLSNDRDTEPEAGITTQRPSRFVLDGDQQQQQTGGTVTNSPGSLSQSSSMQRLQAASGGENVPGSEVRRGRFSVNQGSVDDVATPSSATAGAGGKNSRFAVQGTDTATSPPPPSAGVARQSSRFVVSSGGGGGDQGSDAASLTASPAASPAVAAAATTVAGDRRGRFEVKEKQ